MSVEIRCRYTTGTYVATAKGQKMTASNTISARQAAEALVLKMDLGAGQLQELPPVLHGIHRFQFLSTEKTVATWSPQKPAAPGAYWIRGNGLSRPALIEVVLEQEQLRCNLHDRTTCDDFGFGYSIEQLSDKFEFLGPLHTEAAPGDIKRLRELLENQRQDRKRHTAQAVKHVDEIVALRTQLADALTKAELVRDAAPGMQRQRLSELLTHLFKASASGEPSALECAHCKPGTPVERDERAAFEASYAREFSKARGQDLTAEDIASMRDSSGGYGARAYLNGQWAGWQARAALERMP